MAVLYMLFVVMYNFMAIVTFMSYYLLIEITFISNFYQKNLMSVVLCFLNLVKLSYYKSQFYLVCRFVSMNLNWPFISW